MEVLLNLIVCIIFAKYLYFTHNLHQRLMLFEHENNVSEYSRKKNIKTTTAKKLSKVNYHV